MSLESSPTKIRAGHLQRTAFVYLRQSSPGQMRRNVEGKERQRRMQDRATELGWSPSQVRLLGGDSGQSGSSLHGRDDYHIMLAAVVAGEAGVICARELSRLVRDNQDWNQLVRFCRYRDVLLADEHRIYDPADPQDRVVLGIQGAFNEFELAMITDRMQQSLRQKAQRGEQYDALPPGYIRRQATVLEKHPDARVQRAVEKVFAAFEQATSAKQLHQRLLAEEFRLPVVPHGKDWRDVEWIAPSYLQIRELLRNPTYAGIYARGRTKTITVLNEDGHVVKRRRRVDRDDWDVFLPGHHEPYVSEETWQRNVQKIAANAQSKGTLTRRAVQAGSSLLTGLLRCRRCGRKLYTRYPAGRSGSVRYECRGGAKQRDPLHKACLRVVARGLEDRLEEAVFDVVRPAGIEAASRAAAHLVAQHQRERQLLVDRLQAAAEAEARAAREYKATDATYTTVRQKLAQEWDQALLVVQHEQQQLEKFDQRRPVAVTLKQRAELEQLGGDLRRLWFHADTSVVLKKQIVRTLITEIVVDVDPERDEIVLLIHWAGGRHTELRATPRAGRARLSEEDVQRVVRTLRKLQADDAIAATLNRQGIPTLRGESWTAQRVKLFRRQHDIPRFCPREKTAQGWLTQAEAATRLEISAMSLTRLVQARILPADQAHPGLPSVICEHDLSLRQVKRAVQKLKSSQNRPLSPHPNQLSLLPTTNTPRSAS